MEHFRLLIISESFFDGLETAVHGSKKLLLVTTKDKGRPLATELQVYMASKWAFPT